MAAEYAETAETAQTLDLAEMRSGATCETYGTVLVAVRLLRLEVEEALAETLALRADLEREQATAAARPLPPD